MICPLTWFLSVASWVGACSNPFGSDTNEVVVRSSVTVADAISMTRVGLSTTVFDGALSAGRPARFSPDGKTFVIVVQKGNLQQNTNDYSVLLWRARDAFVSPATNVVLTMRSSSARPAIQGISWLSDNETIAFLGERPGELQQLYTFNIRTHTLTRLTNHPTNLIAYSIIGGGAQFAFAAEPPAEPYFGDRAQRRGIVVSDQSIMSLIGGIRAQGRFEGNAQIFVQTKSHLPFPVRIPGRVPVWRETPFLSPTGRYIIIASRVAEVPPTWQEYTDPPIREVVRRELADGEYSVLAQYILVDLRTGTSRTLLHSPLESTAAWTEVAWSPDGKSVALAGVYLPLDGTIGDEREWRRSSQFAVEVAVPSGDITEISHEDLKLLRWDAATHDLVFAPGKLNDKTESGVELFFQKRGGKWEKLTDSISQKAAQLQVVTDEDMNTPPRLFVSGPATRHRELLLDLNPPFNRLKFGRVEEIHWTSRDGTEVKGGLYYPVDYTPGKRYPLVIQTHGWRSSSFWIDGPYTSGYAAQPLAGEGIMVLQSEQLVGDWDHWWSSIYETPKEAESYQAIYEAAIDDLDRKELIDRNRVGILGFSRTSHYVKYTLTHSRYRFAAASVTDGIDGGYFQYIMTANAFGPISRGSEGMNGGVPFGEGLKFWMERSPGFTTDRVITPVRIMSLDHTMSLLGEWEWFAALRRQKKPVEMVTIEGDDHVVQRPWNRLISQQGNVDWFRFWLKDEEDPDTAKVEQYGRWRKLRRLQEPRIAGDTAATPHGLKQ